MNSVEMQKRIKNIRPTFPQGSHAVTGQIAAINFKCILCLWFRAS